MSEVLMVVERKDVWGQERFYPRCKNSEVMCGLMKKQTMCADDIKALKGIGVRFKQKVKAL